MNSETDDFTFTRTHNIWLVLAVAVLLWLGISGWALHTVGSIQSEQHSVSPVSTATYQVSRSTQATDASVPRQPSTGFNGAQVSTAELLRLREESAEARILALADEAKLERLAQQARLHAEFEREHQRAEAEFTATQQQREAEALATATRLRAEADALAEEARLQAEADALAEAARLQAEADALTEEARLQAEADALAEAARLQAEADALAEQERLQAEARASAEATQAAAVAAKQRDYQRKRSEELAALADYSTQIRFSEGLADLARAQEQPLDRIFEPLYLYSDTPVMVSVATNETSDSGVNNGLSRDRGRAIVAYLVDRGLEKSRFRIRIEPGIGLPNGTQRVPGLSGRLSQVMTS